MAEVVPLVTGGTLVSPAVPDRNSRKNPVAYTGLFQSRKKRILVPVKCFLARSAGHTVLVDTGWARADATQSRKHLGFRLWFASRPVLKEEEAAIRQLEKMHLSPENLDAVIFTHMDVDHVGGARDVRNTPVFYASAQEIEAAQGRNVRYERKFTEGLNVQPLPMVRDPQAPFGYSCDLFGDGSFVILLTPGHTAGSVVVRVTDLKTGKYVLLVGDDGYNAASWNRLNLPGPLWNREDMKKTLQWVAEQRSHPDCVGVYAAHDPDIPDTPLTF